MKSKKGYSGWNNPFSSLFDLVYKFIKNIITILAVLV
jgi:hypothetical protein